MRATQHKKPLWEPRHTGETNTAKFIEYVNAKYNLQIQTYDELYRWSVDAATLQDFWGDAYTWLELAPAGSPEAGRMLESEVINFLWGKAASSFAAFHAANY